MFWINGTKFGLFPYAMRAWQKLSTVIMKYERILPNFSEFSGGRAWSINLAITILEEWAFMWQWDSYWKLHLAKFRVFSSSILSRTVAGREKGARKMGAFIGRRLMIIWCRGVHYEAGPGSQDKKCAASQSHHSPPEITCPFSTKSATWQCDLANSMAFAPNTAFLGLVHCWEHFKGFLFFIITSSNVVKVKGHQFIFFQTPIGQNSIESMKFSLFVWWKVILSVCKCSYLSDHEDQKWNVNKVKVKNWSRIS